MFNGLLTLFFLCRVSIEVFAVVAVTNEVVAARRGRVASGSTEAEESDAAPVVVAAHAAATKVVVTGLGRCS